VALEEEVIPRQCHRGPWDLAGSEADSEEGSAGDSAGETVDSEAEGSVIEEAIVVPTGTELLPTRQTGPEVVALVAERDETSLDMAAAVGIIVMAIADRMMTDLAAVEAGIVNVTVTVTAIVTVIAIAKDDAQAATWNLSGRERMVDNMAMAMAADTEVVDTEAVDTEAAVVETTTDREMTTRANVATKEAVTRIPANYDATKAKALAVGGGYSRLFLPLPSLFSLSSPPFINKGKLGDPDTLFI
jgi:hypothetical protein